MVNVVIVVDMQKGFMDAEGTLFCGDSAREIIPQVRACVERERSDGAALFFTQDSHVPDDEEFQMFPPHCVVGSRDEEVIDELAGLAAEGTIVKKRRYSAFFETDLAERLAALGPEKVVVTGVCTDICVLHTVADLRNRDYAVEVPADCVASFDPEQHEWALGHMDKILGATISNR
jgi:nicotinamidase/pyrazinamidase